MAFMGSARRIISTCIGLTVSNRPCQAHGLLMSPWFIDAMGRRFTGPPRAAFRRIAGSMGLIFFFIVVASAISGCSGLCRRDRSESTRLLEDGAGVQAIEEPEVRQIKGGPTVALLSYDESPATAVQLWSPHGSADVPTGAEGIAEVCAELFCARLPAPDGIDLVTWASHDMTVCEFSAPRGMGEKLLSHLGRLLHGGGSRAKRGWVEERCQLAEERWRRSRVDPQRILAETLFRSAFGSGHPYGRPVLASPNCQELGVERLEAHCDRWFAGSDLVVTAAGDLSLRRLTSAVSYLREEETTHPDQRESNDRTKSGGILVTTANVVGGQVALGFELSSTKIQNRAEVSLLLRLLTSKGSGRTEGELAERLRSSVRSVRPTRRDGYLFTGRHGGLMVVIEPTRPESALETTTALVADALSLGYEPPGESRVAAARLEALQRHQRARNGSSQLARALGFDLVVGGDALLSAEVRRGISQSNSADLAAAAKRLFVRERLSVSVLLPEHLKTIPSGLPVVEDEEGASRVDIDRVGSLLAERLEILFSGGGAPAWNQHAEGVLSIRAPRGQLLIVRQERYSSQVAIRATYPLTNRQIECVPGALVSLREAMSKALTHDATVRTSASGLKVPQGATALSVEGVFLRGNALEGLRLVADAVTGPPIDSDALEVMRSAPRIDALQDPLGMGRLAIREAFYPEEPWLGESEGLISQAITVGANDLGQLHSSIVGSGQLVVSVVGPVEPADVYRAFLAAIADDSTATRDGPNPIQQHTTSPSNEPEREGREVRFSVESPLTTIWFAFPVTEISATERDVLEVLATLLGSQEGQPWRRWVDTGLASEVGVEAWLGQNAGHLAVSVMTTPQNEGEVRRGLSAIVALASSPVTDYEIEQARQIAAGRVARSLSRASARAEALERAHLAGLPPASLLGAPSRILEVDASDVHQLARRLLLLERLLTVVVGAESGTETSADSP